MDAFSKHYRANIDLEENDIMFNSGVMLIDILISVRKTRSKINCLSLLVGETDGYNREIKVY